MEKVKEVRTSTYDIGEGFYMDIVATGKMYEAYIYKIGGCYKKLMIHMFEDNTTRKRFTDTAYGFADARFKKIYNDEMELFNEVLDKKFYEEIEARKKARAI